MNFEFEREIGFINSQPSLAECLTSFPAVLESFQTSSIKDSTVIPPPFEHTIPSLSPCTSSQARPRSQKRASNGLQLRTPQSHQGPAPPASAAGPLAHEFPWMKEKKSSKKCPKSANATLASSSSPSPASSGYATAGLESPTGRYIKEKQAYLLKFNCFLFLHCMCECSIMWGRLLNGIVQNHCMGRFLMGYHHDVTVFISRTIL